MIISSRYCYCASNGNSFNLLPFAHCCINSIVLNAFYMRQNNKRQNSMGKELRTQTSSGFDTIFSHCKPFS